MENKHEIQNSFTEVYHEIIKRYGLTDDCKTDISNLVADVVRVVEEVSRYGYLAPGPGYWVRLHAPGNAPQEMFIEMIREVKAKWSPFLSDPVSYLVKSRVLNSEQFNTEVVKELQPLFKADIVESESTSLFSGGTGGVVATKDVGKWMNLQANGMRDLNISAEAFVDSLKRPSLQKDPLIEVVATVYVSAMISMFKDMQVKFNRLVYSLYSDGWSYIDDLNEGSLQGIISKARLKKSCRFVEELVGSRK